MDMENAMPEDDDKRAAKNAKRREQRAAKKASKEAAKQAAADAGFKPIVYAFRRKDSKRSKCFNLLNRFEGATLEEGVSETNWAPNVVLSEFHEIANAVGAKVVREGRTYRLTGGRRF